MRWKSTLILLALVLATGAYIALYEIKQPPTELREQLARQVADLAPDTVTQVVFQTPAASGTLTRDASAWRLTSPIRARADGARVQDLLGALSPLVAERVLPGEPPLTLSDYGLEPPIATVTLVAGEATTTLHVGEATPVGGNRYLKRADRPEVFVVRADLFELLNVALDAFRDPLLIRLNSWQVSEFTLATAQGAVKIAEQDGVWRMLEPWQDPADDDTVRALLNRLGQTPVARVVEQDRAMDADASRGLEPAAAEITVSVRGAEGPITVRVGGPVEGATELVYAVRSDEPTLYAVSGGLPDALRKTPEELRAKTPEAPSAAAAEDEASGAQEPLDDGQMSQSGEQHESPPEEIPPEGLPGDQFPGG